MIRLSSSRPCLPLSRWLFLAAIVSSSQACNRTATEPTEPTEEEADTSFEVAVTSTNAAFTAVHGTSADDVWVVGADDGQGPVVLNWDGSEWTRHATGYVGDLWWVQALDDGTVFMSGSDAHILKYEDGAFERLPNPGLGKHIVFGLWAASADDLYAVGSIAGRNGFVWHYDGNDWQEVPLPEAIPQNELHDIPAFFKVWGAAPDDVWVVGGEGVILRGNADEGFDLVESPSTTRWFTVHGSPERTLIVGGGTQGELIELSASNDQDARFADATPSRAALIQGVWAVDEETAWAVGQGGTIYHSSHDEWERVDVDLDTTIQSLHAVWVDPAGGVWTVGGNVLDNDLSQGIVLHSGEPIEPFEVESQEPETPSCPEEAIDPEPGASIARRWNEQLLNAIRRDTPRPTVHARNLFHVSIALWDAFATYDEVVLGYVSKDKIDLSTVDNVDAAREEALSYAAYRVLTHRYAEAVGGSVSVQCFDGFMDRLGYDPEDTDATGDAPSEVGNRIGQAVIDQFANDGSNEANNYSDPDAYEPDNPRLIVDQPGTNLDHPLEWQKLVLAEAVTQNGLAQDSGLQPYIGAHWRDVRPFALERPQLGAPYFPGDNPPDQFDDDLIDAVVQIIRKSQQLDISDGELWDISPGGYGNNSLGADDGVGHETNPMTGQPYEPHMVLRGDFTRVLAEFWADGPDSETPPGHWNTLANSVSYHPEFERRLFGMGNALDPLAWDVHLYLALNGAVHDAAIAAWELKREHLSARPISLVRYLAGLGQRTDPSLPSYHEDGLPLVDGLIELITEETTAPGERHAHLTRYQGELAVLSWRGEPGDRDTEIGGVDWVRALDWIPYQRRTFVTPAFPGYTSGHSTFSRAAAEVLTLLTGSEYFPGGLGEFVAEPGYLFFEYGPSETIRLQWATYYDASDQAGQSRLWGGIHIRHDDYDGRKTGAVIGAECVAKARAYYEGQEPSDSN